MNDINQINDIDKLKNLDAKDFLSDLEKSQMSEIFNQVGMDDWVYDPADGSMRLKIKIINTMKPSIRISKIFIYSIR